MCIKENITKVLKCKHKKKEKQVSLQFELIALLLQSLFFPIINVVYFLISVQRDMSSSIFRQIKTKLNCIFKLNKLSKRKNIKNAKKAFSARISL